MIIQKRKKDKDAKREATQRAKKLRATEKRRKRRANTVQIVVEKKKVKREKENERREDKGQNKQVMEGQDEVSSSGDGDTN